MRRAVLPFCEVSVAALLLISAAPAVRADTLVPLMQQPGVDVRDFTDDSEAFRRYFGLTPEDLQPGVTIDPRVVEEIERGAEEIYRRSEEAFTRTFQDGRRELTDQDTPTDALPPLPVAPPYRVTILVSDSMGEDLLRDLISRYPHPPAPGQIPVRFALRGVLDGEKLIDAALRVARLSGMEFAQSRDETDRVRRPDAMPLVVMDPRQFSRVERELVPAIIVERVPPGSDRIDDRSWGGLPREEAMMRAMDGSIVNSVPSRDPVAPVAVFYGLNMSPEEAVARVVDGDRGDQGIFGQTFGIAEEDLRLYAMRMAESRLDQLDLDPQRIENEYWRRVADDTATLALTPAPRDSLQPLSFAQRLNQDITDTNGRVIARAGQIFDPSTLVPWDRRVFVFDPLNAKEVEFLVGWDGYLGPGVVRNVYIASRLPSTGAEELLQSLVDRLDAPVFVLNQQTARAFRLRHTLSVIEPDGRGGVLKRELPLASDPTLAEAAAIERLQQ